VTLLAAQLPANQVLAARVPPGAIVVNSSTPLWYLTRATGVVALVLLTASMALGLLSSAPYQRPAWPRFVTAGLHQNTASRRDSAPRRRAGEAQ